MNRSIVNENTTTKLREHEIENTVRLAQQVKGSGSKVMSIKSYATKMYRSYILRYL